MWFGSLEVLEVGLVVAPVVLQLGALLAKSVEGVVQIALVALVPVEQPSAEPHVGQAEHLLVGKGVIAVRPVAGGRDDGRAWSLLAR